jgi:phosphoserine aminotransferase
LHHYKKSELQRTMATRPAEKPADPCFSSGPCAKRPGWSLAALENALTGRSHRSAEGKARLKEVIDRHRVLLGIPVDYRVAIVPGSDTGAIEMAMWSMLGERGVDVVAWDIFGQSWLKDITEQLKINDVRTFTASHGGIPDLLKTDSNRDVVFTWNGTTSGVCVPDGDWIKAERSGLTFCDAVSGVFTCDLPWDRLDVTTWSWQKTLGGEAAHGMLALSPRAAERLARFKPQRPLPKVFRMTLNGALNEGLFRGETLNTPSMIAVEDCIDALKWAESIGGLAGVLRRIEANYATLENWVKKTEWIEFLAAEGFRSKTSVCLKIVDSRFLSENEMTQRDFIKNMTRMLESEKAGYDIAGHALAPPGLRIWCGPTAESTNLAALLPWIEWAFETLMEKGMEPYIS